MDVQSIAARNREIQRQAHELNVRAGEIIFATLSYSAFELWLKERISGARSLSEIKDLQVLLLPDLDRELIQLVLDENPDELIVLGKSLKVEYRDNGYAPRITLDREMVARHGWRELPDAGIKLPSGRLVEVVVPFNGYDVVSDQDITELKSRCASKVDSLVWSSWSIQHRSAIKPPDYTKSTSVIPEIVERQYGSSAIDGTPLVAFGTVAVKDYQSYGSDLWFEGKWFQNREEAETARLRSIEKFESLREDAKTLNARAEAETVRSSLLSIQRHHGWRYLDRALIERVENKYYESTPPDLDGLLRWTSSAKRILNGAEIALSRSTGTTLADLQNKFGKKY